ncbi:NAD(P)-binding protein [Myriangium duriaei CBS 260.36]|uniref:NAD(P)-binding protein n=1 Tax=Myriangium duriaei CBS 260.36 TaxID=1168546 RepID=A0A9P4IVS2_9PEZI|nr:NAD(P)-binding protein [Myriangium duriaei CBS 260.36]
MTQTQTSPIAAASLFNVQGLIAVVTGGGTGIGLMMAKALAENGAERVYIIGRRADKLQEAAQYSPGVIVPLQGDITSQASLKQMALSIKDDVGYVNLLIANAGITGPMLDTLKKHYTLADFVNYAWATPMEDFTATYNTNCSAMYYTVLAFLELLDEGNNRGNYLKSQVIATASTASFLRHPRAGYAYLSSKAGVVSMIKALSTFCVPWGIRFNTIAAGLFPSDISEALFKPYIVDRSKKLHEEGVFSRNYQPAERAGSIEDMAGTVLYMASRAGLFLNGSVVLVDGGKLGTMPATY